MSHHDQHASDDQNQTQHLQMPSSKTPLLNLILLVDVTFSAPTPVETLRFVDDARDSTRIGLYLFEGIRAPGCNLIHNGHCEWK